jgi:hypothetical protein
MIPSRRSIGILLTLGLSATAFAQDLTAPSQPPWASPSRVLAGVRGHSDEVVEALARLAEHPQLLERVAERLVADQRPLLTVDEVPPELQQAVELLNRWPDVLALAATCPQPLQLLRSLWTVAPDGVAQRIEELRRVYAQAARESAAAWQRALRRDPVALGQYRDLLTRLCEAQREMVPDFACVRVGDRRYYYACPPDETVIYYASEVGVPAALSRVLADWWSEHAPPHADAKLTQTRAPDSTSPRMADCLYDWPAEHRARMWRTVEGAHVSRGLGLVPVALQPPEDQPPAARLAWAVAEQARLWSPPVPPIALQDRRLSPQPAFDLDEAAIEIGEALPGPQTARRDEDVAHGYVRDDDRFGYPLPPYTQLYYGYSAIGPYYYEPVYYPGLGYSLVWPSSVYYSCAPDYGDTVRFRNGYVCYRHDAQRSGRVHYGGGGHYGHLSVSAGGRPVYRHPPVSIRRRSVQRGGDAYHQHGRRSVSRQGVIYRRGSNPSPGRSASPGRNRPSGIRQAIRSGARNAIRSTAQQMVQRGVRAVKSKLRGIRSGNRPARLGRSAIRSTPRQSRPSVRPPSRTGGVRRR